MEKMEQQVVESLLQEERIGSEEEKEKEMDSLDKIYHQ